MSDLATVTPISRRLPVAADGGCAYAVFDPDLAGPCGRPQQHEVHIVDAQGAPLVTLFACEYAQHRAYVEDAGDMLRSWLADDTS